MLRRIRLVPIAAGPGMGTPSSPRRWVRTRTAGLRLAPRQSQEPAPASPARSSNAGYFLFLLAYWAPTVSSPSGQTDPAS